MMEEKKPFSELESLPRVRVFELAENGDWVEQGTGYLSVKTVDDPENSLSKQYFFFVRSEAPGNPQNILNSRVVLDDIYEMQGDSLIVWNDAFLKKDLAISFQFGSECALVWNRMRVIQGRREDAEEKARFNKDKKKREAEKEDHLKQMRAMKQMVKDKAHENKTILLPTPNHQIPVLRQILEGLEDLDIGGKQQVVNEILSRNFLGKLHGVFEELEEMNDAEGLGVLYRIFQKIILLNDRTLLTILFSELNILKTIGVLEYDVEIQKQNHRHFLQHEANFVPVISKGDLKQKIWRSYTLKYLKETILPRVLDDSTFNTITHMIQLTNQDIVLAINEDNSFLGELLRSIVDGMSQVRMMNMVVNNVKFLDEFIMLVKNIGQFGTRTTIFASILEKGLLQVLQESLVFKTNRVVRQKSSNILMSFVIYSPSIFRSKIIDDFKRNKNCSRFMKSFVMAVVDEEEEICVQDNVCDCLRSLLDCEDNDKISFSKESHNQKAIQMEFLNIFYEHFMDLLVSPLQYEPQKPNYAPTLVRVLDLLKFCVKSHGYRSKNYVINNDLLKRVSNLLLKLRESPKTPVKLAAIRFIRACVVLQDVFINNHLIESDALAPVFALWEVVLNKNNMLNSAIINVFEAIAMEKGDKMNTYVYENYKQIVEKSLQFSTFSTIQQNYFKMKKRQQEEHHNVRTASNERLKEQLSQEDYYSKIGEGDMIEIGPDKDVVMEDKPQIEHSISIDIIPACIMPQKLKCSNVKQNVVPEVKQPYVQLNPSNIIPRDFPHDLGENSNNGVSHAQEKPSVVVEKKQPEERKEMPVMLNMNNYIDEKSMEDKSVLGKRKFENNEVCLGDEDLLQEAKRRKINEKKIN